MKAVRWIVPVLLGLVLCGCTGAAPESTPAEATPFVQVDGREMPRWHYCYWLRCAMQRAEENGLSLTDPDAQTGDGRSVSEYLKEQALADTVLYATVETWAERYGCTLGQADEVLVQSQWDAFCIACGGEEAYLASLGLTREQAWSLAEDGRRYAKLSALFCTQPPAGEDAVTAGEFSALAGLSQADATTVAQAYFDHMLCTASSAARVELSEEYRSLTLSDAGYHSRTENVGSSE